MHPRVVSVFIFAVFAMEREAVLGVRPKCRRLHRDFITLEDASEVGRPAHCYTDTPHQCAWRVIQHHFLDTYSYKDGQCCLYYSKVESTWDDLNATQKASFDTFSQIEQGECSADFVRLGKSCYKFNMATAMSYEDARAYCQASAGADLFVLNSHDELLVLQAYISAHYPGAETVSNAQIHVGLHYVDGSVVDVTEGNRIPDYLQWNNDLPNANGDCITTYMHLEYTLNANICADLNFITVCEETP